MLIYHLNNILILIWAVIFCFRKPSKKKNLIFIILAFSQLLAISIFRYKIGYDYNMYAVGEFNMQMDGFGTLQYKDWEIGFVLLTKVLGLFLPNFYYYMAFFAVISIVPAAIFIYKNSKMPWVSTILYVNTFIFFMTMNFIRQAVALSLVMLSWHFIKKKQFFKFLVIILFASLFHQTVLIMIPIYFLVKMKIRPQGMIIYAYFLLIFYISSTDLINILTKFLHEEYNRSIFVTEGISLVYALLPTAIAIIAFLLSKYTINMNDENKYLINMTIITGLFFITAIRHGIIERLSYYTLIFTILLVPEIYLSIKEKGFCITEKGAKKLAQSSEKKKQITAAIFLITTLGVSYFSFFYGLSENAHGVVPYSTWLSA